MTFSTPDFSRSSTESDPTSPLTRSAFPRAIMHFDGDAFFTSVEQAMHPSLRGRPVVTGKERGIIACASYEAKALGIKRGVALHEARRLCPDLVVLPSDYESYSLYSKRMFDIARRFTPVVEEYSIDEGFADLTGLRRVFHCSYADMARQFQNTARRELGISVSIGLSVSKGLAKRASKFRKPDGFTAVAGYHIHLFLQRTPIDAVWGIGPNGVQLLLKFGVRTAWDFVNRPEAWVKKYLHKPGVEIWRELRGESVLPVETEEHTDYASISKCKTFTAPSNDRNFVYAKLVRNVESAFIKLRRHNLAARELALTLRRVDYAERSLGVRLTRPTTSPQEAMEALRPLFERLFREGETYRSTMAVLNRLSSNRFRQYELFEDRVRVEKVEEASKVIDRVNGRFGKHALSLGPSLFLPRHRKTDRDGLPWRKEALLKGESNRCRLNIPRLAVQV